MINLANLFKKFEEAMASSAFAEEGEFDMARQFLRESKNIRKKVLLGTDEREIDLKVIGNALKLCQRVEAGLEILHLVPGKGNKQPKPEPAAATSLPTHVGCMLRKMGIVYNPVHGGGPLEKELMNQVTRRHDIMFVVLGAPKGRHDNSPEKDREALAEVFGKLHCPLVIYEGNI